PTLTYTLSLHDALPIYAGAVILGATNVPLNLLDGQTYNEFLRYDQQPVGFDPDPRRVLRRDGGGPCRRTRVPRIGLRHRRNPSPDRKSTRLNSSHVESS